VNVTAWSRALSVEVGGHGVVSVTGRVRVAAAGGYQDLALPQCTVPPLLTVCPRTARAGIRPGLASRASEAGQGAAQPAGPSGSRSGRAP
jgi:hypothetical protein